MTHAMTESQIEAKLGQLVRSRGGLYYKFVSPGSPGVPDRLIILPGGRVIFLELKTRTGSLQKIQRYRITEMLEKGAEVRVVKGMAEARAFVEEVLPDGVSSP